MHQNTLSMDRDQPLFHRTYQLYNSYRFLLAVIFIFIALATSSPIIFSSVSKAEALLFSLVYMTNALFILLYFRSIPGTTITFAITLLDIILLSLLITMSSQQDNGLANLLFIPIAVGNTLISGRIGVLLAAMASIFLLFIDYYMEASQELDAGLTGLLFFVATFLIQSYNMRLKSSVNTARLSQSRAIDLQKLSLSIMQHMRTGILVLREPDQVIMMNEAANLMLSSYRTNGDLVSISRPLQTAYWQWRDNPLGQISSFRTTPDTPEVQPSFTRLAFEESVYVLVFLDDKATMSQQAQQLKLAALGQLTASIAHEVRNPLGAISHSAQLLSESEYLKKADIKLLTIIHKHCLRINGIIETVLQLSRKESWHPELVDLNEWVKRLASEEHFFGIDAPIISHHLFPGKIFGRFDVKQLHQVVMNLCLNGLRFSQQETGSAKIELRTGLTPSGHPWLEIADQGPGIPEKERDNIFDPFFTTDKNGVGLGLYISKELCEVNHASLELLPIESTGCVFRISFAHPSKRIA